MSHFSVLVIGDNVDEQLAPYIYEPDEPEEIGRKYMMISRIMHHI